MHNLLKQLFPFMLVGLLAACSAMEGVNVGVNVPIGGVVNVGANKTIGDQPASGGSRQSPQAPEDEPSSEDE